MAICLGGDIIHAQRTVQPRDSEPLMVLREQDTLNGLLVFFATGKRLVSELSNGFPLPA